MPKYADNTDLLLDVGALRVQISHFTGGASATLHSNNETSSEIVHFPEREAGDRSEHGCSEFNTLKLKVDRRDGSEQEVCIFLNTDEVLTLLHQLEDFKRDLPADTLIRAGKKAA